MNYYINKHKVKIVFTFLILTIIALSIALGIFASKKNGIANSKYNPNDSLKKIIDLKNEEDIDSVFAIDKDTTWFAASNNKIYQEDIHTKQVKEIIVSGLPNDTRISHIFTFNQKGTNKSQILLTTYDYIYLYDRQSNQATQIDTGGLKIKAAKVFLDNNNDIWLYSISDGVYFMKNQTNLQINKILTINPNLNIWNLIEDSQGDIWAFGVSKIYFAYNEDLKTNKNVFHYLNKWFLNAGIHYVRDDVENKRIIISGESPTQESNINSISYENIGQYKNDFSNLIEYSALDRIGDEDCDIFDMFYDSKNEIYMAITFQGMFIKNNQQIQQISSFDKDFLMCGFYLSDSDNLFLFDGNMPYIYLFDVNGLFQTSYLMNISSDDKIEDAFNCNNIQYVICENDVYEISVI